MAIADIEGPLVVGVHEDQSLIVFRAGSDDVREIVRATNGIARGGLCAVPKSPWVIYVEEDARTHPGNRSLNAVNVLNGVVALLGGDRDFYANPTVSPDGTTLAFVAWDFPSMSWEAGEVWTACLVGHDATMNLDDLTRVDGGAGSPAGYPAFGANDSLFFYKEVENYVQPFRKDKGGHLEQLLHDQAESAGPMWILGEQLISEVLGQVYGVQVSDGMARPVRIANDAAHVIETHSSDVAELASTPSSLAWITMTPTTMASIGRLRPAEQHGVELNQLGPPIPLADHDISPPRGVSGLGRNGEEIFGVLYLPVNPKVAHPEDAAPPVILVPHGGPTAKARTGFDPIVQFYTSRGFAVLAVNYGGSSGYGARYRHRLDEQWGVVDVDDCVDLLRALGEQGLVDADRAAMRGGSAGGMTALLALTTGGFRCCVSHYGVTDMTTLVESTHDFESRYLDSLIGSLPEHLDRHKERSPSMRASEMVGAVLLFQGLDDTAVPPAQAEAMAEALRAQGNSVELVMFEGEAHGWRRLETIVTVLEKELAFFQEQLCQ